MQLTIKGIILGIVIVLPGMSGGTLLLILGLYEKLIRDISQLRLLRWLPFALGVAGGILVSGVLFSLLLQRYTNTIVAFLLGSVLASVKAVLGENYHPNWKRVFIFIIGAIVGFALAGGPMEIASIVGDSARPGILLLVAGGALASAAMVLPGIPGSSVMLIMGIFDDVLLALARLDWAILLPYGLGAVLGLFALSNVLDKIYTRHKVPLSWLFSGLVIGSGRMLIPTSFATPVLLVVAAAVGFVLVWRWGGGG